MKPVKRSYNSALRHEQAAATRERIARSAQRLFAAHGYPATTIEAIAREAGVSARTVYGTYGSKRAVLSALLEYLAPTPRLQMDAALAAASGDPRHQLGLIVEFVIGYFTDAKDLTELLQAARGSEPELAETWISGERFRRAQQAPLVRDWAARGALLLPETAAADVLWALTGPEVHSLFMTRLGWPSDRFHGWLVATLTHQLFRPNEGGA